MKNLFKNVVRSFKNNKISLIGLSFLVFFGVGSFSVLSNTTTNITNEYTSVAAEGAIHDMTISELYDSGTATYEANIRGIELTRTTDEATEIVTTTVENVSDLWDVSQKTTNDLASIDNYNNIGKDGTYYFPIPLQEEIEGDQYHTFTRTYTITLDKILSTGLYSSYAEFGDPTLTHVDLTVTDQFEVGAAIPDDVSNLQELLDEGADEAHMRACASTNIFARDFSTISSLINNQNSIIYNAMTSTDTPMMKYLDTEQKDNLEYKNFQSINITAGSDSVFYKVIRNDPDDTIDKIVMFEDEDGRKGNALFNQDDWAPFNSPVVFYDWDGNVLEPGSKPDQLVVPKNFNEIMNYDLVRSFSGSDVDEYIYSQMMQIRFKRMAAANNTSAEYTSLFKKVAGIGLSPQEYRDAFYTSGSDIATAYLSYYDTYYDTYNETTTFSANGNVVLTWTELLGTIQTSTMTNWTSRFAIVNPQYLKNSGKRVISTKMFTSFKPFTEWYKRTKGQDFEGEISQTTAIEWINSLTFSQFGFWIDPYTDMEDWGQMTYDNMPGDPVEVVRGQDWNGVDKGKYIVSCGSFNLIVWGCGLTPDFMYPVVDISRPTPNTATECLTYCNVTGFRTIKLAYLNAPTEEYLVCKFKEHTNTDRQKIIDDINEAAHSGMMIYPDNIRVAYFATDTSNVLNASAFRIAYIPSLVSVIKLVTVIMGIFIGILCLLICGIIIKRYVENNRINIGIMRANGISKAKIVLSLIPFALLPSIIGGIAAYLIGFFLQAPALLLFSNYWMLPTPLLSFNIWTFLGCIFLPFILFTAISAFATLTVLRTKAVELMRAGSEFKTNGFSRIVKKPFKRFGILTRFRVSLAFNSLLRLSMLAIMSTLTMSSLVFAMTTFDRLSQSQVINSSQFEYNFSLELVTPTVTGGPYSYYDVSRGQVGQDDHIQYLYNTQWDLNEVGGTKLLNYDEHLTKPYQYSQYQWMSTEAAALYGDADIYYDLVSQRGLLQFPNVADADGQKTDLTYLKNRINSRLLLDYNIGLGSITSNPWEIALALMPANSRNIAADAYNEIINETGKLVYDANDKFFDILEETIPEGALSYLHRDRGVVYNGDGIISYDLTDYVIDARATVGKWLTTTYNQPLFSDPYWSNSFLPFFTKHEIEGEEPTYTLNSDISVVGVLFSQFNPSYIRLLNTMYGDLGLMQKEYPISYGMVPINYNTPLGGKSDEFYTYVNAVINEIITDPRQSVDPTHQIKIEGIKANSDFIKLTDNNGTDLNYILFQEEGKDKDIHPVIINAFAAHKYGMGVGSQFKITASNTADRFLRQIHPDDYKDNTSNQAIFKVVGVSRGTNDEAFYTTQKIANNVLGLPDGSSWNQTHEYVLWSEPDEVWQEKDNLIKLADLSDIDASGDNIAVYRFDASGPVPENATRFNRHVPIGFNGIYTQNEYGKPVTSMLPLYSYTGLYPGNSVFNSTKMKEILMFNNNLAIANLMSGINNPTYYEENYKFLHDEATDYDKTVEAFIAELVGAYGETTMIGTLSGAMDVAASDKVYGNLISTFNLAEAAAISIIIPITIIIVGIISNLIINDSKKMAAMLKALGYGDSKNAMSILALFIPTIALGLLLAIPLSFGLVFGYQTIIFNTANILVDVTQKWWYYVVAVGGIGAILVGTYAVGFVSLKKDRLVDQIK